MSTEQQSYIGIIWQTEYFAYPWVLVKEEKYYVKKILKKTKPSQMASDIRTVSLEKLEKDVKDCTMPLNATNRTNSNT